MGLLFLLGLGLVVYLLVKGDKSSGPTNNTFNAGELEQRNAEWAQFIAGYHEVAKTKAEKKLVERMLSDLQSQGLPVPTLGEMEAAPTPQLSANSQRIATERAVAAGVALPESVEEEVWPDLIPEKSEQSIQIDNASLLLYFGAFLFVASVGLFVAFGGLPGTLRTFAVAIVAAVMYIGGLWLYKNRPKLQQAGLAFAGIGLATAPFVGLAAYNFVFNESSAPTVWFLTSVGCMALYLHALLTLKKPLLNYILIFTLLSLVQSGVSIINAPLYYFGWGLAATGLLLTVLSHQKDFGVEFQEASSSSAKLFMPLSSIASLFMIASQGTTQLGVSLALTAAFYASEYLYAGETYRVENAAASQLIGTTSISVLSHSIWHNFTAVSLSLLALVAVELLVLVSRKRTAIQSVIWQNYSSIMVVSAVVAAFASYNSAKLAVASTLAVTAVSAVVWQLQKRIDTYALGVVSWMVLPIVLGQYLLVPHLSSAQQAWLLLVGLTLQWTVLYGLYNRESEEWRSTAKVLYILSSATVVWASFLAPMEIAFMVCAAVAAGMVLLAEHTKEYDWASIAGVAISVPVALTATNDKLFLLSVVVGLLANIFIALRYRQDLTRWLSTILWLLLPVAIGDGTFQHWGPTGFAWAYVVAMAGLIFSRAIARGEVFVSSKIPLAAYARAASASYVVGYVFAAALAVFISLFSDQSQLHTSLILAIVCGTVWLLAQKIERRIDLLTLLPLLAQGLLVSVVRIDAGSDNFDLYLLMSTTLAAIGYGLYLHQEGMAKAQAATADAVRNGSFMAAAITPLSFMIAGETKVMMPVGLLVFTGMLYHQVRSTAQQNREWVGGLGLIAIWWLMWFAGIRNVQAYTHVLAALFALYAYVRHMRGEEVVSDQYVITALATATIPLILQALGGKAGDVYGWWLLLEQVFFMLLGMSIGKSFVTRWGLYVSVGAVLYQLRNLGWAALTVLAMFIIGLAIYRLQKLDDKK